MCRKVFWKVLTLSGPGLFLVPGPEGEGRGVGGEGGGGEVPAARNFKPVNGIEMEFCRVAENHFFIMTS